MSKFYQKFPVVQRIPIDQLKDSPFQPRVDYGNIEDLAESIKSVGLREPILVRPIKGSYNIDIGGETTTLTVAGLTPATFSVTGLTVSPAEPKVGEEVTITATVTNEGENEAIYQAIFKVDGSPVDYEDVTLGAGVSTTVTFKVTKSEGSYEIIHGHRRKRALQHLGAPFAACYVQEMDDKMAIEVALNQNIQREDLNPIEEGRAFKEYLELFDISQRALERKIGKKSPYVNYRIRLLDFPEEIQTKITSGAMSFSNARALLTILDRKNDIINISTKIYEGELKGTAQVKDVVESVKAGMDIKQAVEIAKLQDFKREMAKRISKGGMSIKETLEGIQSRQIGPEVILEAQRKNYLNVVREMLERGFLVCPECKESHFSCSHCGRELLEDSDNHD